MLDQSRRENAVEHSWHLAMYALLLFSSPANTERLIKLLLCTMGGSGCWRLPCPRPGCALGRRYAPI
ncbi:HD domain-containing protein [Chromobacterium haemolyticum]|uniref:HD domain-containing protein n=1 Tax=Chromobacterium haemolyticum TaxID=394935 RepID=UPI003C7DFC5F